MTRVETILAAARTRLILEKPFLGALVLRLPLKEATGNWCTSSATDARSIYYSPAYIAPLSLSQVQFVLAHEALHCGLSHFARREHRELHRWNIACDHAVNPLLVEDGLELAPGALYNEAYTGLSAEEIYPLIKSDTDEETIDQHLYDNPDEYQPGEHSPKQPPPTGQKKEQQADDPGSGQEQYDGIDHPRSSEQKPRPLQGQDQSPEPKQRRQVQSQQKRPQHRPAKQQPSVTNSETTQTVNGYSSPTLDPIAGTQPPQPLNEREKTQLNTQWQQRLTGAAQQASQAGKMNGSVARLINRLLRSTIPWRTVLARFMSGSSRVDYNLMRPSQRRAGDAILPGLHARQSNILIAVDTSGSIEQEELGIFIAEINAIKSLINSRIILLACDRQLDDDCPWVFEPWEHLTLPKTMQGGGGTDFSPVFEWLSLNPTQVDLVVYFTDAQGQFPQNPPEIETLWLVKGAGSVPWGQRIQLN